ncbi:MAG TPA: aspartate carbamoyltransferase [Candidatus Nanoarchaeia archaeon]|nr:aspartate carbamoyltransferase [Candidatus Nanoarchaeia archaeon]
MVRHIIEAQQFDVQFLEDLFAEAERMRQAKNSHLLEGRIMASLFYEPSTRTRLSFESAMYRLGGQVITTENALEFSSAIKGETLEDTVRVVSGYADAIVLRHHEEGSAQRAAEISPVPVINAGDGKGQHPTQTLLDVYTIKRHLGGIAGLRIAMVGDLKNGRTVRSLSYLIGKYPGTSIVFVSPPQLSMGADIKEYLDRQQVPWEEHADLNAVLPNVDCVYMTRIQRERMTPEGYAAAKGRCILDEGNVGLMKQHAIILHPLPRVDEISPAIDADPRSRYFDQAANGLYVRMALLKWVLLD